MFRIGLCLYVTVMFVGMAISSIKIEKAIVRLVPGASMIGARLFVSQCAITLPVLLYTIIRMEAF